MTKEVILSVPWDPVFKLDSGHQFNLEHLKGTEWSE